MRRHARPLFHARVLIVGLGGLAILWTSIALARGGLTADGNGAAGPAAAAAATIILLVTSWIGWIDVVSVMSLGVDERALTIGWPTPRVIPWSEVLGVERSMGTMRLVLRTRNGKVRIQVLVDPTPPKTLARLVRSVRAAGGSVEEYLVRLAEYVEERPEHD